MHRGMWQGVRRVEEIDKKGVKGKEKGGRSSDIKELEMRKRRNKGN